MQRFRTLIIYLLHLVLCTCLIALPSLLLTIRQGISLDYKCLTITATLLTLFSACPKRWLTTVLNSLLFVCMLPNLIMVTLYGDYITMAHLLVTFDTTIAESTDYLLHNLSIFGWVATTSLIFISLSVAYHKLPAPAVRYRLFLFLFVIGLLFLGTAHRLTKSSDSIGKTLDNYFLQRPPLNVPDCLWKIGKRYFDIHRAAEQGYNATREVVTDKNEVYMLVIGESMRYKNISLNGTYPRKTMPLMEQQENLISFSDYYSAACITMLSVPQIITPATPDQNDLTYSRLPVYAPFHDADFYCVGVFNNWLFEKSQGYLTTGLDSIIMVADTLMPNAVQSLVEQHPKLFLLLHLQGSHSYYNNASIACRRWHPDSLDEPDNESDSLLLNAYDNTILQTDIVLHQLIMSCNQDSTLAVMLYTSDHGETIYPRTAYHGAIADDNEYHVPLFVWYSNEYETSFPERVEDLLKHKDSAVHSDNIFYTMLGLGNIILPPKFADESYDISSPQFQLHERRLLWWNLSSSVPLPREGDYPPDGRQSL